MKPHNIKAYTAILEAMPESEVHRHLVMGFYVHRNPDPERQEICREILSKRFGEKFFNEALSKAGADTNEIMKQKKRLHGNFAK